MKIYTIKEVADILRVDYMTIYRMVKDYEIKAVKVRGQWRITEDALNEYMKSHSNYRVNNRSKR